MANTTATRGDANPFLALAALPTPEGWAGTGELEAKKAGGGGAVEYPPPVSIPAAAAPGPRITTAPTGRPPPAYGQALQEHGRATRKLVNGGFDSKFQLDGDYPAGLQSFIPYDDFQAFLEQINEILGRYRATTFEKLCFGAHCCCVLAYGKKKRSKGKKAELKLLFAEFSKKHPALRARIVDGGPHHGELVFEDNPNLLFKGA